MSSRATKWLIMWEIKEDVMAAMEPTPTVELDAMVGLNPFSDTEGESTSWAGGDFFTTDVVNPYRGLADGDINPAKLEQMMDST